MDSFIRDLFRGDWRAFMPEYSPDARQSKYFRKMEELDAQMHTDIPSEYHPLLEEYQGNMMSLMDAACEDDFVHGYRLGIQMLLAAWPRDSSPPEL